MHDKPHERFKELDTNDKHAFYLKLIEKYNIHNLSNE